MTDSLYTSPHGAEARIKALGLALPPPRPPIGSFAPAVSHGGLCFLSGQGPVRPDGFRYVGCVGEGRKGGEARDHARLTTLNLLSALRGEIRSLDRVRRIVKLFGMVNATSEFAAQDEVIAGAVELLIDIFGPQIGRPAGTAVGMGSLPNQITVEIEVVVAIDE